MRKKLLGISTLLMMAVCFYACNDEPTEEVKTPCNTNLNCARNQYCDLENPDTTGGTLTYYCTNRTICQKESDCPIDWVCNIAESFCITKAEAEGLLCDSNEDCTKDLTKPKCKLATHQCVECLNNIDCTALEPYCNLTTNECAVDGGDTGNTGDTGDTGDTGNTGNTGNTGDTGNTGNTGDTGNTGNTGDTGNTGNTGNTGDTGNSGDTGTSLVSEDFEDGGVNWSKDGVWEIGVPTNGPAAAVSGTNVAATSLTANYADNSNSLLVLNTPIAIGSSGTPKIEFMAWVKVEGNGYSPFDYMEVLVKKETDAGWPVLTGIVLSAATPSPLDALDNLKTKVTKPLGTAYYKFTGDLSAYKGKTIQIGFRFISDASDNLEGIYLDDVTVK